MSNEYLDYINTNLSGGRNPYIDFLDSVGEKPAGQGRRSILLPSSFSDAFVGGGVVASGAVSGLLQPLQGLMGLPGALGRATGMLDRNDKIFTDRLADGVNRMRHGVTSAWEDDALELGYTHDDLVGADMLGNVIGFMVPGVALYKGVGKVMGLAGTGLTQAPWLAGLQVDVVSGIVWGGALTPGEGGERFKNALIEGGLSGAVGLAMSAVWPAVAGFRNARLFHKGLMKEQEQLRNSLLARFYRTQRSSAEALREPIPPLTRTEGGAVFSLMSDEGVILNSPAAQDILAKNANESALIVGILDMVGAGGNAGIVRSMARSWNEAVAIAESFRKEFPGIKFDIVKRGGRTETIEEIVEETVTRQRPRTTRVGRRAAPPPTAPDVPMKRASEVTDEEFLDLFPRYQGTAPDNVELLRAGFPDEEIEAAWRARHGGQTGPAESIPLEFVDEPLFKTPQEFVDQGFSPEMLREEIEYLYTSEGRPVPDLAPSTSDFVETVQRTRQRQVVVDAEYDVYFGTRGLSGTQRQQLSRHGRFNGLRVQTPDGQQYRFVRAESETTSLIKSLDEKEELLVNTSDLTDVFSGIEPVMRAPELDALYRDFDSFALDKTKNVLADRYGLSEDDIKVLAAQGRLNAELFSRRRIHEPNGIVHPEEIGVPSGNLAIASSEVGVHPNWRPEGAYVVVDNSGGAPTTIARLDVTEKQAIDMGWDESLADDPWVIGQRKLLELQAQPGVRIAELGMYANVDSGLDLWARGPNSLGIRTLREISDNLADLLQAEGYTHVFMERVSGAGPGRSIIMDLEEVRKFGKSARLAREAKAQQLSDLRNGTGNTWLLHPMSEVTFEDAVDVWARNRGLPTEGPDYLTMRTHFANRMRQDVLSSWEAASGDEAAALAHIRSELTKAAKDMPLESKAAVKGFRLNELPDGSFRLRDINTGAHWDLKDRGAVEEALRNTVRTERDISLGELPPDLFSMPSPDVAPISSAEEVLADLLPDGTLSEKFERDFPTAFTKNTRDLLQVYEDRTGLPIYRRGFMEIDENSVKALHEFSRWGSDLDAMWQRNGIKTRKDSLRISRYLQKAYGWADNQGKRLLPTERIALAKEMGLSAKDMRAIKEYQRIMNAGFAEYGIEPGDWLGDYFGKILPFGREHGVVPKEVMSVLFPDGVPAHVRDFGSFFQTGMVSSVEEDIRIVSHKWFKAATFKRYTEPAFRRVERMIETQFRDLPKDHQARLQRGAGRPIGDHEYVLNEPLRKILREYLNTIQGVPVSGVESTQNLFQKIFSALGVTVDKRVSTEFFNSMLSTMYGSAMGARPMLLARNHMQTAWNLYTRLGAKHYGAAMEDAITLEGYKHAYAAGALRQASEALPFNDQIWEEIIESGATADGLFGKAVASTMNLAMHTGQLSRKVAEKALIPYGAGDTLSRTWAFHYQRRYTADFLQQMKRGKITLKEFVEQGMPYYSRTVKEEFLQRLNSFGEADALDFIGRMGSDETHFVYGMGHQPAWMQHPFGKFLGMFGTWPLWQKEVYMRAFRNGTRLQKTQLVARTAALTGAVALAGTAVGVQINSWLPFTFFTWTGGPGLDHALNLKSVIDSPMDQKAAAMRRLASGIPRLAFPGQVLLSDIQKANEATDDPALKAFYIMMGRPVEDSDYRQILFENDVSGMTPESLPAARPAIPSPAGQMDFGLNMGTLGVAPQNNTSSSAEQLIREGRYEEILDFLGGNVPR